MTMSSAISLPQYRALKARADLGKPPLRSRFDEGVRDAQQKLAALLAAHTGENAHDDNDRTLRDALRRFAADRPPWDVDDYQDGRAAVYDDVASILDGDRETIDVLIDASRERDA